MSDTPSYSLALSDQEVERYRFMAQMARANEANLWETRMPAPVGSRPPRSMWSMLASGHATDADIERWDDALTEFAATAVERNRAYFTPAYIVIARKPAS
jgi:hypothetical protein